MSSEAGATRLGGATSTSTSSPGPEASVASTARRHLRAWLLPAAKPIPRPKRTSALRKGHRRRSPAASTTAAPAAGSASRHLVARSLVVTT